MTDFEPKAHHYHQAGHAAATLLLKRRFATVTVPPDPAGELAFDWTTEAPQQEAATEWEVRLLIALAGLAAERIGQGITTGFFPKDRLVTELEAHHAGSFFDYSMNLVVVERKAIELIRSHWPSVKALANYLLEHGEATCAQAEEVVGQTSSKAGARGV